jgi:ATP-binding cassette, subfamily B, multidrug efflux pump
MKQKWEGGSMTMINPNLSTKNMNKTMPGKVEVGPLSQRFGIKTKPKKLKKTIKRFFSLLQKSKLLLLIIFLCMLISTLASLWVPLVLGETIDLIGAFIQEGIVKNALFLLCLYIVAAFLNWLAHYLVVILSQKMVHQLRTKLFERLESLPLKYFDQRSHGDIMSRFTNDLESVSSVINQAVITLFSSVLTVFGTTIIMFTLNSWITLGVLMSASLIGILSKTISKRTITLFQGQQKAVGAINGMIEESVNGITIIQSFHQEDFMLEEFKKVNQEAFHYGRSAQIWSGLLMPLMNVINNLSFTVIGFMGGYLVIEQLVTVGVVASFIAYSRQFIRPLNELAFTYNSLMSAIAGAERVFEVFDEEDEIRNTEGIKKNIEGNIMFKQVSFGYDPKVKVLKNLSFEIKQGQKVAIVGPTGAGKTTLVNLLTQFYRHDSGEIFVDGLNIMDYNYTDFLKQIGIVLQDSYLFSGTIFDNIHYGDPTATKIEVQQAAEFAMVHDIIMKLPRQYETKLTYGGLNLSHGERQLITIARAVLAKPKLLILDEATSSVDLKTEKEITRAMNKIMENRTSFVIAHRLSTIRDADLILVMVDGEIIEKGNHDALIAEDGFYARMTLAQ